MNTLQSDAAAELREENSRIAEENARLRRELQAAYDALNVISEAFAVASCRIEMLKPGLRSRLPN